ncbi:hypothetical protein ACJ6WE_03220 [Streptomyces sp. MMS24-I31]|uniref:hypothetical protein n=1 Tax=Streptomyces sp. MMS24-I31 TaxID=3351563 RepID=UPI003896A529
MAPGLIADWALWGKEPRTNSGYQVLAAHPPSGIADFNTTIHHWSPGTPAPGDQLPWITMGCAPGPGGAGTVGVFLLDGTAGVDGSNRPIYRISHFAVPYAQVRAAGIGWCALARAARTAAQSLTESSAGPVELAYGDDDLLVTDVRDNITPRVSEITRWLAAAAAHLLDGTVAVTGDRQYGPLQLLLVLDSVAALLPFGMRSTLSAASWTSSGSEVPMRLYWGDAGGSPGVTSLSLGGELPDLGALSPQARTYHDLLIKNWTEHGGEAVVRHLADAREPLDIEGPLAHAEALEVLTALDPSMAVVQAVSEGQDVGTDRIVQALRSPGIGAGALAVLAGRALADPDTDMEALAPLMSRPVVSEAFREQLIEDLLDGRTDVALGNFENMRAAIAGTGGDLDPLDEVLAFVIGRIRATCPQDAPDPVAERLLPAVAPFTEGTMGFTQYLLRSVPGLARRLVRALYERPDPAGLLRAWLRWLCFEPEPERAAEIAESPELPLLYGLLSSGACPAGANRKWASGHPEAASRLLEAAVVCAVADEVLQSDFFQGLLGCALRIPADPDEFSPQAVLRRALGRSPARMRPETAARWDVLCVLADLPPSGFATLAAAARQSGSGGPAGRVGTYASMLQAALDPRPVRQHAPAVVQLLLDGALSVDATTGEGPGPAGRDLALRVLDWPEPYPRIVADAVHRLSTEVPHWRETPEDQRWLERIADRLPQLRSTLALREVHRVAMRCSGTREDCELLAARACAARRAGGENEELGAALQAWAAHGHVGERVLNLLDAYHRVWTSYASGDRADEEREDLEIALIRGSTDRRLWPHYRDHAIGRLTRMRSDLDQQIRQCEREIARLRRLDAVAARTRS